MLEYFVRSYLMLVDRAIECRESTEDLDLGIPYFQTAHVGSDFEVEVEQESTDTANGRVEQEAFFIFIE